MQVERHGCWMLLAIWVCCAGCAESDTDDAARLSASDNDLFKDVLYTASCEEITCFDDNVLEAPTERFDRAIIDIGDTTVLQCTWACVPDPDGWKLVIRSWQRGAGERCWQKGATNSVSDARFCEPPSM